VRAKAPDELIPDAAAVTPSPVQTLFTQEFDDGFGAGADLEFFVDVVTMFAYGLDVDAKHVGDFFVREAFGEQFEHFPFADGEGLFCAGTRRLIMKVLDDLARNEAVQGRAAGGGVTDGVKNLGAGAGTAFEEVTNGSRKEGFEDEVGIFIDGFPRERPRRSGGSSQKQNRVRAAIDEPNARERHCRLPQRTREQSAEVAHPPSRAWQ
jgi:hypothetical protein